MVKWEYKWERPAEISPEYTNRLGEKGWDFAGTLGGDWVVFKRPVKPQMPAILVVNSNAPVPQLIEELKDALREHGWGE